MKLHSVPQQQVQEELVSNTLVHDILLVSNKIFRLKEETRKWYYDVVLSCFSCPKCQGHLNMTGASVCRCNCGNVLDPTLAFQKSACCQARLLKKTFHYACSKCGKSVPSRFLFDEKILDSTYFKTAMKEFRQRQKRKREEIRRLLAESRSDSWVLTQTPDIDCITGFGEDLDDFIQWNQSSGESPLYCEQPLFDIDEYRDHIHAFLGWNSILFTEIDPIGDDVRTDRIARFITLVFMDNDKEVELAQQGDDILVQRVYHDTYA